MPSFALLYPAAKIQSVNSGSVGGEATHEVRLATSYDAATVAAFYRNRFAAEGMQTSSDFLFSETAMLSAMGKARNAASRLPKASGAMW